MRGQTNASNIGGTVGSDTKPVKIVNGVATPVNDYLSKRSEVNPYMFRGSIKTGTAISPAWTWVKAELQTVSIDNGCFELDAYSNIRTKKYGSYGISVGVGTSGNYNDEKTLEVAIFKNGSTQVSTRAVSSGGDRAVTVCSFDIASSTDYYEIMIRGDITSSTTTAINNFVRFVYLGARY